MGRYPTTEEPVHEDDALIAVPRIMGLPPEMAVKFSQKKEELLHWNGIYHGIPENSLPELAKAIGVGVEDVLNAVNQAYRNQAAWEETVLG